MHAAGTASARISLTFGSAPVHRAHFAHGGEGQEARSEVPGSECPPPQQPSYSDGQGYLAQLLRENKAYDQDLVAIINFGLS